MPRFKGHNIKYLFDDKENFIGFHSGFFIDKGKRVRAWLLI